MRLLSPLSPPGRLHPASIGGRAQGGRPGGSSALQTVTCLSLFLKTAELTPGAVALKILNMTSPQHDRTPAIADEVLQAFDKLNGPQPGFRPAHAKGILLSGVFTPSPAAAAFTRAPHIERNSTPVTVRFS